ncbi:MAG: hypothetical protein ACP5P9_06745 [Acidimicrobiales bacterium]
MITLEPRPAPVAASPLRRAASPSMAEAGEPSDASRSAVGESFVVDCAACAHQHSSVCEECVVTFVVGREPDDALVVDVAEARAVHLLGSAGLLPKLRHAR